MKILAVFGTRPEYIKLKPIIEQSGGMIKSLFVQQHTDIIDFGKPDFTISLEKKCKNRLNDIFNQIFEKTESIISEFDAVIVQGDTATACAISLSAFHLKKKIYYVEAGLRSYDLENPFPEEGYRQIISRISTINFCPTKLSAKNLKKDNVIGKNYVVGNTSLDNLLKYKNKTRYQNKVLITLHRNENIPILNQWLKEIDEFASKNKHIEFIFPVHPNKLVQDASKKCNNIALVPPLEHDKLLSILKDCLFVITDSGGIQEEASFLNKKIIVCRKTTERPEGIKSGHIIICNNPDEIKNICEKIKNEYLISTKCPYGNGKSSKKIIELIINERL